jgi:hypothetical protein
VLFASAARFEEAVRIPGWAGARVETDAEGEFELVGLADGELFATPGQVPGFVEPIPVLVPAGARELILRLERGVGLAGRVVDPDGQPVDGARVTARLPRPSGERPLGPEPSYVQAGWSTQTDRRGTFALAGLPADARVVVSAEPPSPWLPASTRDVAAGADDLVLQVTPGVFVEGAVSGDWVEDTDLWVELWKPGTTGQRLAYLLLDRGQRHFRVGPVAPGEYELRVKPSTYSEPLVAQPVRAPASGLTFPLPAARHVVGRILGENVGGFHLGVFFESTNVGTSVDGSGRFRMLNARPGRVTVVVHREGDERYGLVEDVDPSAGSIDVPLQRGLAIEGRVTGLPAGERVTLEVTANQPWMHKRLQNVDGDRFRVVGLLPGRYDVTVECRAGKRVAYLTASGVVAGGPEVVLPFESR